MHRAFKQAVWEASTWVSLSLAGEDREASQSLEIECWEGGGLRRRLQTGSDFGDPGPAHKGNCLTASHHAALLTVCFPELKTQARARQT